MSKANRLDAVEAAVAAVEQLEVGAAWAALEEAARRAIDGAVGECADALGFGRVVPIGADILADIETYLNGAPGGPAFGVSVAAVHAAALASHPTLAAALRSEALLSRVGRVAGLAAVPPDQRTTQVSVAVVANREARAACVKAMAAALAARGEGLPHSEHLGSVLPALATRLETAGARHAAHALAEEQRIAAELAEAERIQREELLSELDAWFAEHATATFKDATPASAALLGLSVVRLLKQGDLSIERAQALRAEYVARVRGEASRLGMPAA